MNDRHVQFIALFLIILGCVCISIGEWKNWIHLVDFANTFGGGGVGILTGQKLSTLNNNQGGKISVQTDPAA